jgi:hypothetical protein
MFPVLTETEIERVGRFGTVRHYSQGTRLFAARMNRPLERLDAPVPWA